MWFYVQKIQITYQVREAAAHDQPRGNFSDLYPRWLGTRELLLHRRDPYSPEITREIQVGYYGRPLDSTRPSDPKDQQAFAYPLYVVFMLVPSIFLPFAAAHTIFFWFLVFLTALTVPLWIKVINWHPSSLVVVTLIVFSLGSFPAVQGLKLQQLTLLVYALISISVASLVDGRYWVAGIFLALSTIKPQLTLILILWFLLWALSDLSRRRALIYSFGLTMAALLIGAEFLLPGWIWRFRDALAAYSQYTGGLGSTLDALITPLGGRFVAAVLIVSIAIACWKWRCQPVESPAFALSVSLILALTVTVIPMISPYNQMLLLPGIFLLVRNWHVLLADRLLRTITVIAVAIIFWPWLASAGLALASIGMPAQSVQRLWRLPLYTSLAIPSSVLVLLIVYARKTASEFSR